MKKLRLLLLLIAGITMATCSSNNKSVKSNNLEGKNFSGVIPCADCRGIAYQLSFLGHQTYQSTMMYLGKSNRAFSKHGSWKIIRDTVLVLKQKKQTQKKFAIHDTGLVMLNRQGKITTGPLASHYFLAERNNEKSEYEEKTSKDVDFAAFNSRTSWKLRVNFEQDMHFVSGDDSLSANIPMLRHDSLGHRLWKASTANNQSLQISLSPTGCFDKSSGELLPYHVSVKTGNNTYEGCGYYRNERARLNDSWTLAKIPGSTVNLSNAGQKTPSLTISLGNKRIYGTTGCNHYTGKVDLKDGNLRFSKLATTKMACPGKTGKLEQQFLHALKDSRSYRMLPHKLSLMNKNDTLMVFQQAR